MKVIFSRIARGTGGLKFAGVYIIPFPPPLRGMKSKVTKEGKGKERGRKREGEGKEKRRRMEGKGKEKGRRREGEGKKKGREGEG